ncbi:MAG: DUF1295 domain-containing protein [Pseudomonadota bacterium]
MTSTLAYIAPLGVAMIGFLIIWPLSVVRRDASLVDIWWGPGFFAQAGVAFYLAGSFDLRQVLLLALIGLWAMRLGFVLIRRRIREGHEDPRYTSLRQAWDPGFWWKSLFVVFLLQSVIQWAIMLGPITAILADTAKIGLLAVCGLVLALVGFLIETKADAELDGFKRTSPEGSLCETGMRAHVRHPNYSGEILFWVGIGLIIAEVSFLAALISPLLITLFLTKVSGAPMLDERLEATRSEYAAYKARVPGFIPRLRKNLSVA